MKTDKNELQLVNYDQACKLKKIGFDWDITDYYGFDGFINVLYRNGKAASYNSFRKTQGGIEYFSAPPIALALKWFRDIKGIVPEVRHYWTNHLQYRGHYSDAICENGGDTDYFDNYEEAESALIDKLLNSVS